MKRYGERKYSSADSSSWCLTYVSCHLCALAALFLMPKTVQEAGWAQERVWTIWGGGYAAAVGNLRFSTQSIVLIMTEEFVIDLGSFRWE